MKIRGIILAGGTSTRMGKNKLDLMLDGKKIVQIVINNATQSKLDELIAVYGKYEIKTDITKVFNSRYE
jgi:molybdenum cofactor cytidylyltransferase